MLTLTFFALSFLGTFAISPTLNTIAELNKKLADSEFVESSLKTKLDNLSSLNSQYESIAPVLPAIESAVPNPPQVPLLMAQIQKLAQDTGVTITNMQSYQVALTKEKTSALPKGSSYIFTVTLEGSLSNLLQFVETMSTFDRVVTLESINLTNESTQRLTLRAKTFFLP
jgi:Tfp pilus assembly protein PilO